METDSSIYDDDINDMINADLFTRDWEIVGTTPPTNFEEDESNDDVSHLIMYFEETPMVSPVESESVQNDKSNRPLSPIVLSNNVSESIEILPISFKSLGIYYNYFESCVKQYRYDQLINVCRNTKKSPCFDIKDCYLCIPQTRVNLNNFTTVEIGDLSCVILIPSSIIHNMMDSLTQIGISVVPTLHDSLSYNGSRVRMSKLYTEREINKSMWKGNTYAALFRNIIKCKAVTTATLTVSIVLGVVYGHKSQYNNRKSLTVVVHAIK